MSRIKMSKGKFNGLKAVSNQQGIIAALAIDQRGSLRKTMAKARGSEPTDSDMGDFKTAVTEELSPYASAVLLDPEFGLQASRRRAKNAGLFLAYEKTGYDVSIKGRFPDLLPEWSVLRLVEAGANVIKLLLYYDAEDQARINSIKQAFIERVGAECCAHDVPFFLEVVAYSDTIGDEKGLEFARAKPARVAAYMREFSQPRYGVDVLKVEVPVNMRFVQGSRANVVDSTSDAPYAYTRAEASALFREAAAGCRVPFIYLSAGVSDDVFRETLELAAEAGTPFSGILCGRATWQEAIPEYGKSGVEALRSWLAGRGVQNIQALNEILARGAKPWWDFYGGIDNIEII